jgi:hypothetical protein
MSKHIGFPSDRLIFKVKVLKVVIRQTDFGQLADHTMATPDGDILFWSASTNAPWLKEGELYTVKGTVKTHDADEDGTPRTILLRVAEHREPERIPRVSVGLARGAVRRR